VNFPEITVNVFLQTVPNMHCVSEQNKKLSCFKETVRLLGRTLFTKYNWKTIFHGHYRYIFNHCYVIGL